MPLLELRRSVLPPRGWRRAVAVRRAVAAALVVLAVTLLLAPRAAPPGGRVVVAVHDIGPDGPLGAADLAERTVPVDLVPAGAVTDVAGLAGRRLVGGMRAGEAITDVRLLGPAAAVAATGVPDAAGVPLRLADPAVAGLLGAGVRVDVVGVGSHAATVPAVRGPTGSGRAAPTSAGAAAPGGSDGAAPGDGPSVLAAAATVLGVVPPAERSATGPVVVVALPGAVAARVAAASLSQEVTVTLR